MAEAFLQVLLENLSSLIQEEIGLILGVDEEMKKLRSTLTTIQAVLEDAEDKQVESRQIRDWLRKLNALVYEIDDIMDECNTEFSKRNHADSKLCRYNLKKILYRRKIARRVKQVTEKLNSVAAERSQFHLREMPVDRPREVAAWRETRSVLNESDKIYGREEDREKIVKMLVDDAREKEEMTVLPIIGVGGLGKTTLAQLVFNDPRVLGHFDKRIWVCVSDNFEIKSLVKAMIESANGKAPDLQHLNTLEGCLREVLSQKRYLVVLDDVWNEKQEKWSELKDILSCGSTGASILVTTRLRKVADIMGTLPAHCLKGLSDEHCWMLLRQCAFGQEEEEEKHPELKVIGEQIVKKCAGVPLAQSNWGTDCESLSEMPSKIRELTRLKTLSRFVVGLINRGNQLEELQCLNMIGGSLEIRNLERVKDPMDAKKANIAEKKNLRQLSLWWERNNLGEDVDEKVLEALEPHQDIEKLSIRGFSGRSFPLWMTGSTLGKVVQIVIEDCLNCRRLPNLGELPHLRGLRIGNVGVEFIIEDDEVGSGNPVNLEELQLSDLPNFKWLSKEQESKVAFPKLKSLSIVRCETMRCIPEGLLRHLTALQVLCIYLCPELVELPEEIKHLHNLESLILFNCPKVASIPALPNLEELSVRKCPELVRRCERERGEDWHNIAHIPRLHII